MCRRFDTDRSGTIEVQEFVGALGLLGTNISLEDAKCMFGIVDGDGDGRVTLPEFTEHWLSNYA